MSWNKNSIIISEVDSMVSIFEQMGIPYSLKTIAHVQGMGLNDQYECDEEYPGSGGYDIRRLDYKDKDGVERVILEQMRRTYDCDSDDCLISVAWEKSGLPENWEVEVWEEDDDFGNTSPPVIVKL